MYNFCTLFDSYYLSRGLTLYSSLLEHCPDFHLHIFAFDKASYTILLNMGLEKATIVSLDEFEDDELLSVKNNRTRAEYCWTCSGKTIQYVFKHSHAQSVTYLDADICFFSSPEIIFNEMGDNSILLTEHRYPKGRDNSGKLGKYCVQYITFRRDEDGLNTLNWWCSQCINWCYARVEEGRFGDQKYLDYFVDHTRKIHVLENLGGGLAPWNNMLFRYNNSSVELSVCDERRRDRLVFYHFHGLKINRSKGYVLFTDYKLMKSVRKSVYQKYYSKIKDIECKLVDKYDLPRIDEWDMKDLDGLIINRNNILLDSRHPETGLRRKIFRNDFSYRYRYTVRCIKKTVKAVIFFRKDYDK